MTALRLSALLAVLVALPAAGRDDKPANGYVSMFNGRDLTGWVNVNCHPGTFFVKDGEIVTTGKPTGFLRTQKQYENFELEMEWMHVNKKEVGNSGLFVWGDPIPAVGTGYTRGIEVQVLVNLEYRDKKTNAITATSHGDLFSIWGATCVPDRPHPIGWARCLPSENRAKGGGEWNHYKVIANDGVIKLHVNGKEVSGVSKCNPRKGYLALESEDAECHFKNLKIKELPSTNPKLEECAKVAEGHVSLFSGMDLKGWAIQNDRDVQVAGATDWQAAGGRVKYTGPGTTRLVTDAKFSQYELIYDMKLPAKAPGAVGDLLSLVDLPGGVRLGFTDKQFASAFSPSTDWLGAPADVGKLEPAKVTPGAWARVVVRVDGQNLTVKYNGRLEYKQPVKKEPPSGPIRFASAAGLEIMNVFVREIKEK
jgi:hypothetical protein